MHWHLRKWENLSGEVSLTDPVQVRCLLIIRIHFTMSITDNSANSTLYLLHHTVSTVAIPLHCHLSLSLLNCILILLLLYSISPLLLPII